jgi:hypothetical protein
MKVTLVGSPKAGSPAATAWPPVLLPSLKNLLIKAKPSKGFDAKFRDCCP